MQYVAECTMYMGKYGWKKENYPKIKQVTYVGIAHYVNHAGLDGPLVPIGGGYGWPFGLSTPLESSMQS